MLTVDGRLARERPEIVARYMATLMRASRWAAKHEAETLQIVSGDVGATPEWVTAAYGPDVHRQLDLDLAARSIEALDGHKRFLLDQGFIEDDFVVAEWIDPRPLAIALEMLDDRGDH